MKIGLLGGSFNPIHNSHIWIAKKVLSRGIVDFVWFIPCAGHAFGKELVSSSHRLEMIRIALSGHEGMALNDIELSRSGKSYTSDTLRELRQKYPQNEFFYIIGSDNLRNIRQWKDFEYLRDSTPFIIIERPSYQGYSESGLRVVARIGEGNDVSSTEIRKRIIHGESLADLTPDSVKSYILKEGLYG
jgi:nicotinate-nucleotide adenylyltransferase